MEPKGSLPHSQVPHTCPYPEPVRLNPHPHILKIHLNVILPSTIGSPKWSLSLRFPHPKKTIVTLSILKPTRIDLGSNQGLCDDRTATNLHGLQEDTFSTNAVQKKGKCTLCPGPCSIILTVFEIIKRKKTTAPAPLHYAFISQSLTKLSFKL